MLLAINFDSLLQQKARQGILTSLFCLLLTACGTDGQPASYSQYQYSGPTMGTQYHISVVLNRDEKIDDELQAHIDAQLAAINQSMSTYLSDSELSRLNRAATQEWIPLSEPLFAVITLAQRISLESDGAFDITMGPLVELWGFGARDKVVDTVPSAAEINSLLAKSGYQQLELQGRPPALKKLTDTALDLSAIAKGFAVDEISYGLTQLGYANHMVEIGGEVKTQGHNARGDIWHIGIESPTFSHTGVQQAVTVQGVGIATSGDYRNYFEINGQRFSHTINPRTGRPITHNLASVTVIAPTCAEADAYATAINVLGFKAGKMFAEQRGLAAYFIVRDDENFSADMTSKFKQYLTQG